ncbi:MAG: hypothetical protein PHI85_08130 [Victivallaceae bacterium]|nr:hypothetical protein [Victivallaceae bacterium]
MKKTIGLLTAALIGIGASAQQTIAERDFSETVKYLDAGGLVYNYTAAGEVVALTRTLFGALLELSGGKDAETGEAVLNAFFEQSGLAGVRGAGASAAALADGGGYRFRSALYAPDETRHGFIWNVYGREAHELSLLKMAPAATIIAVGSDFNTADLCTRFLTSFDALASKSVKTDFYTALAQAKTEGFDLQALAGTVKSVAVILTDDGKNRIIPGITGATLLVETSDSAIFNALTAFCKTEIPAAVQDGQLVFPAMPTVTLTVFELNGYLVVSTEPAAVRDAAAGTAPDMTATPEFKKLAALLPARANSFIFIPRGLSGIIDELVAPGLDLDRASAAALARIMNKLELDAPLGAVGYAAPDALLSIGATGSKTLAIFAACGNFAGSYISSMPAAASMLLPSLSRARSTAKSAASLGNLRQIMMAVLLHTYDQGKPLHNGAAGFRELSAEFGPCTKTLISPNDESRVAAASFDDLTEDNVSYVLVGGVMYDSLQSSVNFPVSFEKPGAGQDGRVNTVFADGHAETLFTDYDTVAGFAETVISTRHLPEKDAALLRAKAAEIDLELGY